MEKKEKKIIEKSQRNLELTKARLSGVKPAELAKKYKITVTRVMAIVTDTKAKYSDLL